MYRGTRIAVVVPAYNEERLVVSVIETLPDFVDHIIVVDDCSHDKTSEVARATGDPRLKVIRHEQNRGVGGAVVTGYGKALALGAEIVAVMAGDGQMDPAYLSALCDPIVEGRCEMSKGNRFFKVGSFSAMPRHRIVGNVALSFLTRAASGYWHIFDPQNGYVAVSSTALRRLPLEKITQGYSLENDMLIHMNIIGARVIDIPVPARYGSEQSKIKLIRVAPSIVTLLIRGFWRRIIWKYVLWSFSPVALFLFAGLSLCGFGVAFGCWVLVKTLGPPVATTGTVLLAVVPFLIGVQFLISALVLDIQESPGRV